MPYVSRGPDGRISGIFHEPQQGAEEFLSESDPDILGFITKISPAILDPRAVKDLEQSDSGLVRVIEDLIDLLIEKKLLTFTELPEKAREKILHRKDVREKLAGSNDLVVPEEKLL